MVLLILCEWEHIYNEVHFSEERNASVPFNCENKLFLFWDRLLTQALPEHWGAAILWPLLSWNGGTQQWSVTCGHSVQADLIVVLMHCLKTAQSLLVHLHLIGLCASERNSLKENKAAWYNHNCVCSFIFRLGGHYLLKNTGSGILQSSLCKPQDSNTIQHV